jgi:CopG family transcriptional regulator, nickel-responsive regulator
MGIKRFGVSLDEKVLEALDNFVQTEHFPNRSRAIHYLISEHEAKHQWDENKEITASILLVYNPENNLLNKKINEIIHAYPCLVLAAQHIILAKNKCLETVAVKGQSSRIKKLADKLKGIKGIENANIVMSEY